MYVVCVTAWIKEGFEEDFVAATLENAKQTRQEAGNARFDFSQCIDPPSQFFLYEVYHSAEDFKQHQQTPHYLKWRETVADWMAQKRQGVKHNSIFPDNAEW